MTQQTVKALIVYGADHPRHPDEAVVGTFDMKVIKTEIDGWLEGIGPNRGDLPWSGYCDEEGKLKHRPINPVATKLAYAAGWHTGDVLCGTVVFLGPVDNKGYETDVHDALIDLGISEGLLIS